MVLKNGVRYREVSAVKHVPIERINCIQNFTICDWWLVIFIHDNLLIAAIIIPQIFVIIVFHRAITFLTGSIYLHRLLSSNNMFSLNLENIELSHFVASFDESQREHLYHPMPSTFKDFLR